MQTSLQSALNDTMLSPDQVIPQVNFYAYSALVDNFLENNDLTAAEIIEERVLEKITAAYIRFLNFVIRNSESTPAGMRIYEVASAGFSKCLEKMRQTVNKDTSELATRILDLQSISHLGGFSSEVDFNLLNTELESLYGSLGDSEDQANSFLYKLEATNLQVRERSLLTQIAIARLTLNLLNDEISEII